MDTTRIYTAPCAQDRQREVEKAALMAGGFAPPDSAEGAMSASARSLQAADKSTG